MQRDIGLYCLITIGFPVRLEDLQNFQKKLFIKNLELKKVRILFIENDYIKSGDAKHGILKHEKSSGMFIGLKLNNYRHSIVYIAHAKLKNRKIFTKISKTMYAK